MRLTMCGIALLCALGMTTGNVRAEMAVWKFSGVLPEDAAIEGFFVDLVQPGESWTAWVGLDTSVADVLPDDSTHGKYPQVTMWAKVEFSGGFSDYFDAEVDNFTNIQAWNDYNVASTNEYVDGLAANASYKWGDPSNRVFNAQVITNDQTTLLTDALPTAPIQIVGDDARSHFRWGGYQAAIRYNGGPDRPITFETVPEPSTIVMWSFMGSIATFIACRRSNRARRSRVGSVLRCK